ncbi:MAG: hypothetical protein IT324_13090 [Anaerolineae bacterium]|nr:hypothetical protein [Anaerolineae bacterium]
MTTPQDIFGDVLQTVARQVLAIAGYQLQDNAMHQSRGLFRYRKTRDDGVSLYIEFQMLYYQGGGPSRFRVNLLRNTGADARSTSQYTDRIDTTLGKLIWDDFGVRQLSGPDHWWVFHNSHELGFAIAEAGKLLFAFGIPWLEGTLQPDDSAE